MDNIFGLSVPEMEKHCASFQIPSYRARQIAEWIYKKGVDSFEAMTNIPKPLRTFLPSVFLVSRAECVKRWDSSDGCTSKFLLRFDDGVTVESVLMRQPSAQQLCCLHLRSSSFAG